MLNNKLVIGVFVVVCLAMIAASVFRLLTPQEPELAQTPFVAENFNQTQTQFNNILFQGDKPSFPSTLPLVATQPVATEDEVVDQLTKNFELIQDGRTTRLWTNTSTNAFLHQDQYSKKYTLGLPQPASNSATTAKPNLTQNQIVTAAQSSLRSLFPDLDLTAQEQNITFLSGEHEHVEDGNETPLTFAQAEFLKIPFGYSVQGLVVQYQKTPFNPFEVSISKQGDVLGVSFYPQFLRLTPVGDKKLISIDQAVANINNDQGSVISTQVKKLAAIDLNSITNGSLTSVTLEYRVDPNLRVAYPFYRFKGDATNNQNVPMSVEIITPAVATTTQ